MPGPLRVFISHSSLDHVLTDAVAAGLRPGGSDPWGYEVLLDQTELKPGVEWPRYLHEWMARCHAAVILLTQNAVRSPWVLKETTILTWRLSLDPNFRLFIVRFPDVDDALLDRERYSPLFLPRIQRVAATAAPDIVTAVRRELGQPTLQATLFETLVGRLADVLERVGLNTLKEVAAKLDVVPVTFAVADGERARYVDAVARHLVCGVLGRFGGVHEIVDALSTAGASVVSNVLRMLAPYWVDAAAAARLPPLLHCAAPRRAAGINGALPDFTAEMLVRKAHQPSLVEGVIPIAGGWDGRIVAHVTAEICAFMRKQPVYSRLADPQIVDRMTRAVARYYACLPAVPDPKSLGVLIDTFPTVAFLLWTGEVLTRDPTQTRVEWLEPIDLDREERESDHYASAQEIISRLM